jgi:hypothetical protein
MRFLKWDEPKKPWATRLTQSAVRMLAEISESKRVSQSDWLEETIRKSYYDSVTKSDRSCQTELDLEEIESQDREFLKMVVGDTDPLVANRLTQGITHHELAAITGIDRTSINRYALGKRKTPTKISDNWFYHAPAGRWFPKD